MIYLVAITGLACMVLSIGLALYFTAEHVRKATEKAIALYYRDHQTECVMMLNRISLIETKKEIELQKQRNEITSNG
jgi:hypothetical protein